MNSKKIFGLALALTVFATSGLWAQSLPGEIWSSPQSDATQGRFRSSADDFIRPDTYTSVKFNKWYGFTSFAPKNNYGTAVGYATKLGSLYLGAFYTGGLWAGLQANNNTVERDIQNAFGNVGYKTYTEYTLPNYVAPTGTSAAPNGGAPINNVALLFGVADMGFRLTYRTNHQAFKQSDFVDTGATNYYKNLERDIGYHAPQIAWAMAKDLTSVGIRPYATVELQFNRNYRKESILEQDYPVGGVYSSRGDWVRSDNRTVTNIGMGLGGITLSNKDGFKFSADADYVLSFTLYDNDYSYQDAVGNYKTGNIKGYYTFNNPGNDPANMIIPTGTSSDIQLSLSGSWSKDNLAFKFKFVPAMVITGSESSQVTGKYNPITTLYDYGSLVENGAQSTTTNFQFRPDLRLAMQWKIFGGKLALNASERLRVTAINVTTTESEQYTNGTKNPNSGRVVKQEAYGAAGGYTNQLRLGVTFMPVEYFSIEAVMGNVMTNDPNDVGDFGTNNSISVFGQGDNALFNFGSILIGFKF